MDFFNFKCNKLVGDICTVNGETLSRDRINEVCTTSYYLDCKIYQKCYVVTAVCQTLKGKKEYLYEAMNLRSILEKNPAFFRILETYDAIGPIIAQKIKGNEKLSQILFDRTIEPVCELIKNGENEKALKKYIDMIRQFIEPEYRTKQQIELPNRIFDELKKADSMTIENCQSSATTHLCIHRIEELTNTIKPYTKKLK